MEAGLLERDDELARLHAAVGDVADGSGRVVLIVGEPGIGKSALLRGLSVSAAQAGLTVLRAAGAPLERDFGYGVVRQLLERTIHGLDPERRERLFGWSAAPAAPVFSLAASQQPTVPEADPGMIIRHALVWLVDGLAEDRPLALIVDDLHWADGASVRWFTHLAQRVQDMPVLLAAALRPAESDDPALVELAELAVVMRPCALGRRAVAELAATQFESVDDRFSSACHELTAGNPLLLHDLLRAAREDGLNADVDATGRLEQLGAQRVADRVVRRLSRVSADARALVAAVAVLETAQLHHATSLGALEPAAAQQAADELMRAGLLGPQCPLRIVHPLLRAAIEADLPPARRWSLHRHAAQILHEDPARADEAATHLLAAQPAGDAWVVARLMEAASRAEARGAPDAAVAMLLRALDEPPGDERAGVLAQLGRAENRVGRHGDAAEHLREAARLAPPDARESLARDLGVALGYESRLVEAAAVLEAAMADLSGSDMHRREARLRLEADLAVFAATHEELAVDGLQRLGRVADGLGGSTPGERVLLAMARYRDFWLAAAPADDVADGLERVLALGDLLDDQTPGNLLPSWAAFVFWHADRPQRALDLLEAAEQRARLQGLSAVLACTLVARSRVLASLGELVAAEQAARDVETFDLVGAHRFWQPAHLGALVTALLEQGLVNEADGTLESRHPTGRITPLGTFHIARMGCGPLRDGTTRRSRTHTSSCAGSPNGTMPACISPRQPPRHCWLPVASKRRPRSHAQAWTQRCAGERRARSLRCGGFWG